MRKDGDLHLVQCKQWKALKVSVNVVRELYGVMAARGAAGGYIVTLGAFTVEARAFAVGKNIELIDGERLDGVLGVRSEVSRPAATGARIATEGSRATPPCPNCTRPMVRRIAAGRGRNKRNAFWGCSADPGCRGIR